ncbi:Eukaryotic peptide chain release factor subunit 1-3 [Raphanus sativus]|nr:Eukaryotic peptide chain release factor subunit 1-3 [Raphanus sativus]
MAEQESDKNIEIWKIKKLIKGLESARGNGTSMISLIMPPRDQVARVTKMLADEYGTASNIKSRVNRQSVLSAITSAQQRLKLYNKVPPNGLVLYTGTIVTDDGKEKKVTIDFEPFKPINASLYLCDNKFHTEPLNELLESDDKFGFIVMDGNGTLFGTLSGNTREVLHKFTVDLPKKHGRGGQSALRFARLRMEKRHNYVRKTAELATQFYINPATSQPNVSGLILAGSADFKTELSQSELFDPRLQAKILNVVDVSYGGENGFNQAIELSAEILSNVKFIQEKKLIGKYFEEISQDTGKYVFGVDDTLKALDMGAVETLIVWENLDINRYELKNNATGEIVIKHLGKDQENDQSNFHDAESNAELEVVEKMPLLEWFANEYKRFGCTLEFVTNKSQEGSQFCRGFGGIGGLLRYQLDMRTFDELSDGEGFTEFSGLRSSSASLPLGKKLSSDEFVSAITFQTSAIGSSGGYRKGVTEAKLTVAINGFGRIGRNFLRCWHGRKDSPLDIIAINDTGGVKQASHLLKYDSTLGIFDADVKPSGDAALSVDGKIIQVVSNRNPSLLP